MKKGLLLFASVCMFSVGAWAQVTYQVGTDIQKKKVLLEEFTGIHCGWCPEGHKVSKRLLKAYPNESFAINIHEGHYSVPNGGEPDYRTAEGDSLGVLFNSSEAGYPSGTVNRETLSGRYLTSRSNWIPLAQYYTQQDAPVNLFVKSEYDGNTGILNIHIEGYYTGDVPEGTQTLNVCWTQDDILGPQNEGGLGDAYSHQHMLRAYITPIWGDTLKEAAKGQYFSRDYQYTLPEKVVATPVKPEDINVIAFVTTNKVSIENVEGGKPIYTNYNETPCGEIKAPDMPIGTRYGYNFFDAYLKNKSSQHVTSATFDVTVNGVTESKIIDCDINQFSSAAIRIPATMQYADKGKTKYSVVLTQLNGTDVPKDTLSGSFQRPAYTTTTVKIELKTDKTASQDQFLLKDADGNIIKEYGPFEDGKVETINDEVTLEEGKTYCFEITDSWGDGLQEGSKGSLIVRSGTGRLIDQFYTISNYGLRSFFTVDTAAGIKDITSTPSSRTSTLYTIDGRQATTANRSGIYIIKENNKTTKRIIK